MMETARPSVPLPRPQDIRKAISIYLAKAYPGGPPPAAQRLLPPENFDPAQWLMSDSVERTPPDAPLEVVRSFAVRLGNAFYPHMKLRLSRPPRDMVYVFTVDSHDAFLSAPPNSPDYEPLEQLKRHNATLVAGITGDWESAGLLTERDYLRRKIKQARGQNATG